MVPIRSRRSWWLLWPLFVACAREDSQQIVARPIQQDEAGPVAVATATPANAEGTPYAAWCWKILPAPFVNEHLGVFVTAISLVATSQDVWLGYTGLETYLSAYERGHWSPARVGSPQHMIYDPTLATRGGRVFVAWRDSGVSQSVLQVARRDGVAWTLVGGEVGGYADAFTNAGDQVIAVDASGNPTIVWAESKAGGGGGGPRTLFSAHWNGQAWSSPATVDHDVNSPVQPSLALDEHDVPWVAWTNNGRLQLARWSGSAWQRAPGPLHAEPEAMPHVVIERAGTALVTWTAGGHIVAGRTNGTDWHDVASPASHGVRFSALAMSDGTPLIGWSQGGRGEIASLYLSRLSGDHWIDVFRMMQADTGQSDVGAVALASHDNGVYVAWNEPGDDKVLARIIDAKPCTPPETPAEIARSRPRSTYWPKSVDEAVTKILATMDDASKKVVRDTARADLIKFHLSWGMGIRNEMGLWQGNTALMESCGVKHPDDCSMIIIEKTWERLHAP